MSAEIGSPIAATRLPASIWSTKMAGSDAGTVLTSAIAVSVSGSSAASSAERVAARSSTTGAQCRSGRGRPPNVIPRLGTAGSGRGTVRAGPRRGRWCHRPARNARHHRAHRGCAGHSSPATRWPSSGSSRKPQPGYRRRADQSGSCDGGTRAPAVATKDAAHSRVSPDRHGLALGQYPSPIRVVLHRSNCRVHHRQPVRLRA